MIEIKELMLRVPGLSEKDGDLLAKEVANGLKETLLAEELNGNIRDIDLQLQISNELPREKLAKYIIRAIARRIAAAPYKTQ